MPHTSVTVDRKVASSRCKVLFISISIMYLRLACTVSSTAARVPSLSSRLLCTLSGTAPTLLSSTLCKRRSLLYHACTLAIRLSSSAYRFSSSLTRMSFTREWYWKCSGDNRLHTWAPMR